MAYISLRHFTVDFLVAFQIVYEIEVLAAHFVQSKARQFLECTVHILQHIYV